MVNLNPAFSPARAMISCTDLVASGAPHDPESLKPMIRTHLNTFQQPIASVGADKGEATVFSNVILILGFVVGILPQNEIAVIKFPIKM